jgi:hypothetical protein
MIINAIDIELQEGKNEFIGHTINLNNYSSFSALNYIENFNQLKFINCIFNGDLEIENFINKNFKLLFKECTFNGDILITEIDIDYLHFINTKKINNIHIDGLFNRFRFNNKDIPLSGKIAIYITVFKELNLDYLFLKNGDLDLVINDNDEFDYTNFHSTFENAKIDSWTNTNSFFGYSANFREIETYTDLVFDNCKFNKSIFYLANFARNTTFNDCKFYSRSSFEECKNIEEANLKISRCLFTSFPHFNSSEFNHLEISHTTFERKVSFDSLIVNRLKLNQVTFLQGAYFDDIQIKKIDDCDRKTIRTIKQELQKAENRIDFNRFRNYELLAHYKELSFRHNFKDKFILWATKWSSNYGSWTWAFWFTLIICFVFFTSYFILENLNKSFDLSNGEDFVYGYFRFFLITDFKNEYYDAGESVLKFNCFISLFPFIIGKIAVAFGLYEMIQSFRKFKA